MGIRCLVSLATLSLLAACGGSGTPPAATAPTAAPVASAGAAPATSATPATADAPKLPMYDLQVRSLRAYVAAFNKHDAKAIAALYSPEAVFVERGEPGHAGHDAITASYQAHFDAFPDVTTAITRSWHWGDAVLFEFVEGGTQSGTVGGHAPTGKKFGYVGASVLHLQDDGLVHQDMTYTDELTKDVQSGWARGPLAQMAVRPLVTVPAASDTWETHKVGEFDATQSKVAALKTSLYSKLAMRSDKDFLTALTDNVVLSAFDDPKDAQGKAGAAALFKDWMTTFAEGTVEASEGWSVDGYVVLMGTYSGKHTGAWGPIKPTGKTFKAHFLDISKVGADSRVEHLWSYANNYEILVNLGYGKEVPPSLGQYDPLKAFKE